MDRIRIRGGKPLNGTIRISGAKNAALPLMVASLLSDEPLTLHNMPRLADIATMIQLLAQHRRRDRRRAPARTATATARRSRLHGQKIDSTTAPYDLVRKMRASVLVLGPLVAR